MTSIGRNRCSKKSSEYSEVSDLKAEVNLDDFLDELWLKYNASRNTLHFAQSTEVDRLVSKLGQKLPQSEVQNLGNGSHMMAEIYYTK